MYEFWAAGKSGGLELEADWTSKAIFDSQYKNSQNIFGKDIIAEQDWLNTLKTCLEEYDPNEQFVLVLDFENANKFYKNSQRNLSETLLVLILRFEPLTNF